MKKSILASVLLVLSFVAQAQFSLQNLQVEYQKAPLGLDEAHPRFSWQMNSTVRNAKQSAYRIVVQNESGQTVWDSKKQNTDISLGIQYAGEALKAKTASTQHNAGNRAEHYADMHQRAARLVFVHALHRQEWQDRQDRNRCNVLKQQHGKSCLAA